MPIASSGTISLQGCRNYYQSLFPLGWPYNLQGYIGRQYYHFVGGGSPGGTNGAAATFGSPMHMAAFYGTSSVDEWTIPGGGGGGGGGGK